MLEGATDAGGKGGGPGAVGDRGGMKRQDTDQGGSETLVAAIRERHFFYGVYRAGGMG